MCLERFADFEISAYFRLNRQYCLVNRTAETVESIKTRWYRKPISKNSLIQCQSAHPSSAKNGITKNMFRTATSSCDGEQKLFSVNMALDIPQSNGYPGRTGVQDEGREPATLFVKRKNVRKYPSACLLCQRN